MKSDLELVPSIVYSSVIISLNSVTHFVITISQIITITKNKYFGQTIFGCNCICGPPLGALSALVVKCGSSSSFIIHRSKISLCRWNFENEMSFLLRSLMIPIKDQNKPPFSKKALRLECLNPWVKTVSCRRSVARFPLKLRRRGGLTATWSKFSQVQYPERRCLPTFGRRGRPVWPWQRHHTCAHAVSDSHKTNGDNNGAPPEPELRALCDAHGREFFLCATSRWSSADPPPLAF